jgi:hypothetical protein
MKQSRGAWQKTHPFVSHLDSDHLVFSSLFNGDLFDSQWSAGRGAGKEQLSLGKILEEGQRGQIGQVHPRTTRHKFGMAWYVTSM